MPFELGWTVEADEAMTRLEADQKNQRLLRAVVAVLEQLQRDPFGPTLHTRQYVTPELGQLRSTRVGVEDWVILWQLADDEGELLIRHILELPY